MSGRGAYVIFGELLEALQRGPIEHGAIYKEYEGADFGRVSELTVSDAIRLLQQSPLVKYDKATLSFYLVEE